MPACLAQALCQGVYPIVEDREKLDRRLAFRLDPNVTFYPLDSNPTFRLGEDYGGVAIGGARKRQSPATVHASGALQTMSNKKQQRREDYAAAAKQPARELPCRNVAF